MDYFRSVLKVGQERARPIFMTSLTTIAAMLPLTLSKGESAGFVGAVGLVGCEWNRCFVRINALYRSRGLCGASEYYATIPNVREINDLRVWFNDH